MAHLINYQTFFECKGCDFYGKSSFVGKGTVGTGGTFFGVK